MNGTEPGSEGAGPEDGDPQKVGPVKSGAESAEPANAEPGNADLGQKHEAASGSIGQAAGPGVFRSGRPDAEMLGSERVWVLDDPRADNSAQAIGVAERLGVGYRRIPLQWSWMAGMAVLSPRGSLLGLTAPVGAASRRTAPRSLAASLAASADAGRSPAPALVIASGGRSAAVALWVKARFGCPVVLCARPGLGELFRHAQFDLMVIPAHDHPPAAANVIATLGTPHRLSPLGLRKAAGRWRERLGHLPHPRIALLMGGARDHPLLGRQLTPSDAHTLGRRVARIAANAGGSVMATTSPHTSREATEALAAGLGRAMHLIYRWGEPWENPYLGYLALADAIVVTADSAGMLGEACATGAAIYVAQPQLASARDKRLIERLVAAEQVRPFGKSVANWERAPLDEAGRVARELLRRFPIG